MLSFVKLSCKDCTLDSYNEVISCISCSVLAFVIASRKADVRTLYWFVAPLYSLDIAAFLTIVFNLLFSFSELILSFVLKFSYFLSTSLFTVPYSKLKPSIVVFNVAVSALTMPS